MICHLGDHTITDKHGVSYDVVRRSAYGEIEFRAYDSTGKCIALAELPHQHSRYVSNVFVEASYRRRGIAGALYDLIEQTYAVSLRPSHILLSDGELFWLSRNPSLVSSARYTVIAEDPYLADVFAVPRLSP